MLPTTTELLDRVKARHELTSDYKLSKFLGIRSQAVTNYRSGRSGMSRAIAMRVADALELPREYVYACAEHGRERDQGVREVLESIATRFRGAAIILIAALGTLGPAGSGTYGEGLRSPVYTLCALGRRRVRRRLDRFLARFLGTWFPAQLLQPLAVRP